MLNKDNDVPVVSGRFSVPIESSEGMEYKDNDASVVSV